MYLKISILLLSLGSLACTVLNKPSVDQGLKTISLHGTVHKPYCGGARPTPEVAAGYYETMKFEKFKVLDGTSFKEGMTPVMEIALDEGGNATFQLKPGDYLLMRSDKFLPLDEFIKKNGVIEEKNYRLKDNQCFIDWKNSADLYLKVVNDTVVEYRQRAKCWVGTNPCLEYTGPPAP